MNTNILFSTNLTSSFELNLTSNLVKSSSSKDFNEMFDSTINKFNENIKSIRNEVESKVNTVDKKENFQTSKLENDDNVHNSKEIKTENKKIEKSNLEDKDLKNVDKMTNEEKEKLEKAAQEVLYNILDLLNNPNVDLSEFVEVDSDGMFKVNLEAISDLTSQLKDVLGQDVIARIDKTLESSGLDLEKVTTIALDFVVNEANAEMIKLSVDDSKVEEMISYDNKEFENTLDTFETNERAKVEVNTNKEIKIEKNDTIATNDKVQKSETIEKFEDVNKVDNFEILKNTINELVDKVEIEAKTLSNERNNEKSFNTELTAEEIVTTIKNDNQSMEKSLNVSDNTLKIDENNSSVMDETKNELSDKSKSESKDGKENKDVERININKVESTNNVETEMFNQNYNNFDDFNSVMQAKSEKQTVTDKFLESFNVAKQMVKGVEMKVTEATSEMSIQLDPENLGKVNLKIVTENGIVMAKFEAESQRVKEIIESNLSLLKESLENKGISISGLEVSVGQNMNGKNSNDSNLEYMRKVVSEKNPHKILGKTINKFNNFAEIGSSQNKSNGLFMTRSKINYIA